MPVKYVELGLLYAPAGVAHYFKNYFRKPKTEELSAANVPTENPTENPTSRYE